MTEKSKKILVHTCCAACAGYVVPILIRNGFAPVCFFDHPEVDDQAEFANRLESVRAYCKENEIELVESDFGSDELRQLIEPFKNPASIKCISDRDRYRRRRCLLCNTLAIQKTIEAARKKRIKYFTTTLLCSPYKDFDQIVEVANEKSLDYNLTFYYQDFRKGYWTGRNYARNHQAYIPRYCGCLDSEKEKRLE